MFIMFLFCCFFFSLSKFTLLLSVPVNPGNLLHLVVHWKVLTLCVLPSLESHRQYSDFQIHTPAPELVRRCLYNICKKTCALQKRSSEDGNECDRRAVLYLLLYVKGLKVKALIGFMSLFLLAVVVTKGPHKCRTIFCFVLLWLSVICLSRQKTISWEYFQQREGRGGEGMELSPDIEKTTQRRPPFLTATHASEIVGLIRDRSTI